MSGSAIIMTGRSLFVERTLGWGMFRRISCIALVWACHPGPPTISGDAHPGVISGTVENAYTGEPVAGARLHVREHGETVESDEVGRFVLTSIPPGTHRVTVQAEGFLSGARENVVVEADGETRITVRVFPANPTPLQQQQWLQRRERRDTPTGESEAAAEPGEVGSITQALGGPAIPETIRVWRSQGSPLAPSSANGFADRSCEGDVLELDFEEYVKGVIPHEWIPSWHPEALRAGAIAARSYAASHALGGGRWDCADVDDGTVTQVYRDDRAGPTDEAVDATRGLTVVRGGVVLRTEYSAENSHPTASDGIDDPLCAGSTLFGHGRGACQWGTQRWATSTCFAEPCDFGSLSSEPKDHLWMLDHYFPGTEVCAHEPALPCPLLPAEGGVIDDATSCFEAFGPSRYWRREGEGLEGGLHWTNAFEGDTPSNWARWEIRAAAGSFDVEVYIEDEFAGFERARYVLRHAGEDETFIIDMGAARDGWLPLGRFDFDGEGEEHLSLYDNYDAPLGDDVQMVADAIRIRAAEAAQEDAGVPPADAGADSAVADAAMMDAGGDAGMEASDGGCGCALAGRKTGTPSALLVLALLLGLRRKLR
ncbi:MAG: hypothetical protein ACI9KE_001800 [Polyangiales bacterium]|jgi:hypothetical protein